MKLLKTITITIEHSERLATCDQSNKEAYPDQQKDEDKDKDKDHNRNHPQRPIREICDLLDI